MTTTATHAFVGPLTASGTTPLPFDFQAITDDEVGIMKDGVLLVGGYTVDLNEDGTGEVIPTSTWDTSEVYIFSNPTYQQEAEFSRHGPFYPDDLNHPLDVLGRQIIALRYDVSRAITAPIGQEGLEVDLGTDGMIGVLDGALHYYDVGEFMGPPGEQGDPGPEGPEGPPGEGMPAENPNYTYAINTLAPGASATINESGVYPDILLTFGIPRGDPGASGALVDGTYSGIIVTGTGANLDVVAGHITLARMANVATATVFYRKTAGTGVPEVQTLATLKTDLAYAVADISGLTAALAAKADLASPALTGNPTAPTQTAGNSSTRLATTAFVQGEIALGLASAASNTITPTYDDDVVQRTITGNVTFANPTGTAVDGHGIVLRIKSDSSIRTISYGSQYRAMGVTLPTATVASKWTYLGIIRNSTDSKWDVVSVVQEAKP